MKRNDNVPKAIEEAAAKVAEAKAYNEWCERQPENNDYKKAFNSGVRWLYSHLQTLGEFDEEALLVDVNKKTFAVPKHIEDAATLEANQSADFRKGFRWLYSHLQKLNIDSFNEEAASSECWRKYTLHKDSIEGSSIFSAFLAGGTHMARWQHQQSAAAIAAKDVQVTELRETLEAYQASSNKRLDALIDSHNTRIGELEAALKKADELFEHLENPQAQRDSGDITLFIHGHYIQWLRIAKAALGAKEKKMSDNFKEFTFAKQIERTAKLDAYSTCLRYIEKFGVKYALEVIKMKADGHREFLEQFPCVYNYATQSLDPKPPQTAALGAKGEG